MSGRLNLAVWPLYLSLSLMVKTYGSVIPPTLLLISYKSVLLLRQLKYCTNFSNSIWQKTLSISSMNVIGKISNTFMRFCSQYKPRVSYRWCLVVITPWLLKWFTNCLVPKELIKSNWMPRDNCYHLKLKSLSNELVSCHREDLSCIHRWMTSELLPGTMTYLKSEGAWFIFE